jgi:two-component system chemotaxis response regulator CheB
MGLREVGLAQPQATRDVVVVGGSAGGLDGMRELLSGLPANLPAALFLVLHIGESSELPAALARCSALPVMPAANGAAFRRGVAYVGIPGQHLLLHEDHVLLRRGPRENFSRPAIDALFRSAAVSLGSRVIGVLLSGALSDGTVGLRAIKRCGGLAIVQDPRDALMPDMPRNALRHVDVDHVVPVAGVAALLARLTREPAGRSPEVPVDLRLEAAISAQELADMKVDDALGKISRFTCPECHGALWEIEDGSMLRFRCHVGHAFTADAVLSGHGEEIERMLGSLQRGHQERAALARRMAVQERAAKRDNLAERLDRRAREYDEDAQIVMELLRRGFGGAGGDAHGGGGTAKGNGEDQI